MESSTPILHDSNIPIFEEVYGDAERGDKSPGIYLARFTRAKCFLEHYRGQKNVVLAFYPLDFTGG